jgi:hypothetical protein
VVGLKEGDSINHKKFEKGPGNFSKSRKVASPLLTLYYYSSKFARPAQMIWKLKALGVGNSSRQGAKSPSSEKNLFLITFAP